MKTIAIIFAFIGATSFGACKAFDKASADVKVKAEIRLAQIDKASK